MAKEKGAMTAKIQDVKKGIYITQMVKFVKVVC